LRAQEGISVSDNPEWMLLLEEPAPLKEVVILGNGKDCDFAISLGDGREGL
jgi:hypothetical protein